MIWIILDTAFVILALGAGVASILLAMRLNRKFEFEYLNSFMYYQILLFIFGLYGLLGTIFVRSILIEFDIPIDTIKNMAEFIPYIGVPVIFTAWFIFLKMSFEMIGKRISQTGGFIYFGTILVSMLLYILIIFIYLGKESVGAEKLTSYSKYGFLGLQILTQIIAFFVLYRYGFFIKHKHKRTLVLNFANINFVIWIAMVMTFIYSEPNTIIENLYMFIFFAGQLPPVFFLAYYLDRYFLVDQSEDNNDKIYELFISNYQLSKREWEIVEHICTGLTNNQISEKLFISLQTVKDHVYRIYKKTGVKNRVQLVNMIGNIKK